ncbi:Alpha/Beta hydrolase protein [Mycena rebaudengoi]|nr:Alpha/Beta hydrolase protein [Mycena rebaudengoi]
MESSPTIAHSSCDHCFTGFKHSGDPAGKTITIANVPTYLSEPPTQAAGNAPKKIILFFPDVFGPFYPNNQLLQDHFAAQGFIVLGIDYFLGDTFHKHTGEADFDRDAWIQKSRTLSESVTPKWLEAVRKEYGTDAKYCAVGYCFGGPFTMELGATDDVVAVAFAHPGHLVEDHFSKIKQPLLLSCAESDFTFPLEFRRRAEDLLVQAKATYHIQVFSGVEHGFANRGDPNVEHSRWAKEESARAIIGWFTRFCA